MQTAVKVMPAWRHRQAASKTPGASGLRNDEDSGELWPCRPITVLFIAAEPHFRTYKSQIESVSCYCGLTASVSPFPTPRLTVFHHYGADIRSLIGRPTCYLNRRVNAAGLSGTGQTGLTFVVNQPSAHFRLSAPGRDNVVSPCLLQRRDAFDLRDFVQSFWRSGTKKKRPQDAATFLPETRMQPRTQVPKRIALTSPSPGAQAHYSFASGGHNC